MTKPLPVRRTAEFEEIPARVSKYAVFTLKGVLYSVPSQLIGHRLMVRQYAQHVEGWLGGQCVVSLPRARPAEGQRVGRSIDYPILQITQITAFNFESNTMIHALKSATIAAALCATAALANAGTPNLMSVSMPGNSHSTATNTSATMTVNEEALADLVKSSIEKSMGSDGREITVSVNHGVATVSGWANTAANSDQARMLAYRVPGVVQSYSDIRTWSSRNR